jgi:hypothetical protein
VSAERLYGLPGFEFMQDDPAAVWECVEGDYTDDEMNADGWSLTIEEWSVADTSKMLPRAEDLVERIVEWWCEETSEDHYESIFEQSKRPEVTAAFDVALDVFGAVLDAKAWRMADRHIADHKVTWANGQPFYDGDPMYRPLGSAAQKADTP